MSDGEKIMNCEPEVRRILEMVEGEGVSREGLERTPYRVNKAYKELFEGYHQDPKEILSRQFAGEGSGMVVVKDILFNSMCEHHMLPFIGVVHIGYIPGENIVGLSKLARLTDCFAHRLQVQERLQTQIVEAIMEYVKPEGVGVIIKAKHQCMCIRGVKNPSAETITSTYKGIFLDQNIKSEFLKLISL